MGKPIVIAAEVDPRGVATGVGQATGQLGRLQGSASRVGAAIKTALVAGVAVGLVSVTGAASEAQQSIGATESVYGKYADTVIAKSNAAADAVGLSANAYREQNNVLGSMLKNAGTPMDKLAGKTDRLVKLGADLAATYGGPTSEAVDALGSLMRGEADPIERYGVSIKQSDVNARLAAQGLDKLTGQALKQAEAQARLSLLYDQTKAAQGQFGRESETFAGQQQRAAAGVSNLQATIGTALLPALTEAGRVFNTQLLPPMQAFADRYGPAVGERLGDIAANIGPLASGAFDRLGAGIRSLNDGDAGTQLSSISDSLVQLRPLVGEAVSMIPSFADVLSVTSTVMAFAADNTDLLAKALPFLVAGYVGVKAAGVAANVVQVAALPTKIAEVVVNRQLVASNKALIASRVGVTGATVANTAAETAGTASRSRSLVGMVAQRVAMTATAAVTGVWTAAQWALNAAMTANPIGIVIVGLVALGAGLVVAYKKSETFRNIVNGAFRGVAAVGRAVGRAVVSVVGRMSGAVGVAGRLIRIYFLPATLAMRLLSAGARAMASVVSSRVGAVVNVVSRMRARVVGAVKGAAGWLKSAGANVVQGFISGIRSMAGRLVGAIKSYVIDKIPGPVKKALGIASPSRVFREIGKDTMAGLTLGLADNASGPVRAVQNVARDLAGTPVTLAGTVDGRAAFDAKGKANSMPTLPLGTGSTVIHQTINITVMVDPTMTEAQIGAKILRAIKTAVRQGYAVGDVKVVTS